ncbi:unnamed protein product [Closterium sp. NIES-64]|nr:unnamed protein product [Closterium sp. NIES-64]
MNQIDVSGNSLYRRINRDFESIETDGDALINLAHNFFFGDGVLFAAGCKVCPTEVSEPNKLNLWDASAWLPGACNSEAESGKMRNGRVWICVSNSCCSRCWEDNVLGQGGFGIVYKGRSPQGQLWAIKCSTIMTNDFETEVRAMASLHHSHLVRLLGFCLDQNVETGKQEQILVYEFMANRDLAYHIYKTKPNILVRADMQAKVADFGLLKCLTHGNANATRVAGTPGYVDPNYVRTHVITVKSDVFSFGIVLLELLSGSCHVAFHHPCCLACCFDCLAIHHLFMYTALQIMEPVEAYEMEELKDSKMPAASKEAIVEFADLALDCIKSPGTWQPTMKDVAYRLSALIEKHCPDREDEWESVAKEGSASTNDMSSTNVPFVSFRDGGRESERSPSPSPSAIDISSPSPSIAFFSTPVPSESTVEPVLSPAASPVMVSDPVPALSCGSTSTDM